MIHSIKKFKLLCFLFITLTLLAYETTNSKTFCQMDIFRNFLDYHEALFEVKNDLLRLLNIQKLYCYRRKKNSTIMHDTISHRTV